MNENDKNPINNNDDIHNSASVLQGALVVSVPEMARVLHIGRTKAYEMIRENRIRHFTVGRDIRIPVKAILEFLDNAGRS